MKWVAAALGAICGYNLFEAGEVEGKKEGRIEGFVEGLNAQPVEFEPTNDNQEAND